jgi:hypothetical protein
MDYATALNNETAKEYEKWYREMNYYIMRHIPVPESIKKKYDLAIMAYRRFLDLNGMRLPWDWRIKQKKHFDEMERLEINVHE